MSGRKNKCATNISLLSFFISKKWKFLKEMFVSMWESTLAFVNVVLGYVTSDGVWKPDRIQCAFETRECLYSGYIHIAFRIRVECVWVFIERSWHVKNVVFYLHNPYSNGKQLHISSEKSRYIFVASILSVAAPIIHCPTLSSAQI